MGRNTWDHKGKKTRTKEPLITRVHFVLEDEEFGFDTDVTITKEKNGEHIFIIDCPRLKDEPMVHLTLNEEDVRQFRRLFNIIAEDD